MYPERELSQLALRKDALRLDIALRRAELGAAAGRVAAPLAWLEEVGALWRRMSPWAMLTLVSFSMFAARPRARRQGVMRTLLRWASALLGVWRAFGRR